MSMADYLVYVHRGDLNVLIIAEQMIREDFPWDMFDLVVQYEHSDASPWKDMCIRFGIDFMSLQSILCVVCCSDLFTC